MFPAFCVKQEKIPSTLCTGWAVTKLLKTCGPIQWHGVLKRPPLVIMYYNCAYIFVKWCFTLCICMGNNKTDTYTTSCVAAVLSDDEDEGQATGEMSVPPPAGSDSDNDEAAREDGKG